jgi:hypothetical protein
MALGGREGYAQCTETYVQDLYVRIISIVANAVSREEGQQLATEHHKIWMQAPNHTRTAVSIP